MKATRKNLNPVKKTKSTVVRAMEEAPAPTPPAYMDFPCVNNGLGMGKCADKYFVDIEARFPAPGQECPSRCISPPDCECLWPCLEGHLGPGECLEKHYIDTTVKSPDPFMKCPSKCRDETGKDCNCDIFPCVNQGFPPGTCIDKHYIDLTKKYDRVDIACPVVCREPPDCDCGPTPTPIPPTPSHYTPPPPTYGPNKPAAPSAVFGNSINRGARIFWDQPTGGAPSGGYVLESKKAQQGFFDEKWARILDGTPFRAVTIVGLENGTTYLFRIASKDAATGVISDYTDPQPITPSSPPPTPTPVRVAASEPRSVSGTSFNRGARLTWSPPETEGTSKIVQYSVEYKEGNSGWKNLRSKSNSLTLAGLNNDTPYTFRVAALNGSGLGAYSTVGPIVPANPSAPPSYTPIPTPPSTYSGFPCVNNGLGMGKCSDKYFVDTDARYSTPGQECPSVCRRPPDCDCLWPCIESGLGPGECLEKHYIDTTVKSPDPFMKCPSKCRDETGKDCNCDIFPCVNQGFPPGTCIDKHYIDLTKKYDRVDIACPVVCREPPDCDCGPTPTPIPPTPSNYATPTPPPAQYACVGPVEGVPDLPPGTCREKYEYDYSANFSEPDTPCPIVCKDRTGADCDCSEIPDLADCWVCWTVNGQRVPVNLGPTSKSWCDSRPGGAGAQTPDDVCSPEPELTPVPSQTSPI